MPVFGLVEESTMNEYAAPYTPSMPFFTLPPNSEPPYSSYSVTSIQPDVSSVYYYDSGYTPYVSYCPDFSSSSSNPQFSQDWYVGSTVPPVSHDWYSENEDPAIPYYPAAPSFDNNGFYAYGSCQYPEQLHGDPLVSSTVITTTPWENCPAASTAATTATDFYETLHGSTCGFYGGHENKEDKQRHKVQEEDNSTASRGHYLDKIQTARKSTESFMEGKQVPPIFGMEHSHAGKSAESSEGFKQISSPWQESASGTAGMDHSHAMSTCLSSEAGKLTESFKGFNFQRSNISCQESAGTTVGLGNSHSMPTCFDFEGFPIISPQKDLGSDVEGPFSRKMQQSSELLEPIFGWTASYPADIPVAVPMENFSLSRPMSSASESLLNRTASYLDDARVPRPNFPVSRQLDSATFSIESSLPTLFGNYDKYNSPMLLSPRFATERALIDEQESKGKAKDARGLKSNTQNIGNRQAVSEGTATPETSFGCSIKTKKAIYSPATTDTASHVLDLYMKSRSSASPSHCNDPSNCVTQLLDVPSMNDILCNDLSSLPEMEFHTKRMEDFLANCSKGGECSDDALLTAKSNGLGSYPTQNTTAAYRYGQFSPILDITSSDYHPSKPSKLFPMSLNESASSFSTSPFVDGSTSYGVLGPSKMLRSSLIKNAPIFSALQLSNESKGSEEAKPCQSLSSCTDETASVECTQASVGNAADSLSENMKLRSDLSISSKESVDPGNECHKLVHTMHNLSVVLLASSSSSDNLRGSDVQVLQSIICNLSQCLVKMMGLSTSTVATALEPEKLGITPNVKRTQKACKLDSGSSKVDGAADFPRHKLTEFVACSAFGGKEVALEGTNSFHISAESMQSQMVNIEADMDLMKFEIRCLKMELETERLRKSHEGALKFGDGEISANKNAVSSGISPVVNLGIKGSDLNHAAVPISEEKDHGLPDLNLNPISDSAVQTDTTIMLEDILLSLSKIHGESILNSSFSTYDQETRHPNPETGTGKFEDPSGSKLNMGCISGSDEGKVKCTTRSSLPESKDGAELNGQHEVPPVILTSLEIGSYFTDGYELKSNNHIHSLQRTLCDNTPRERDTHLEDQNGVSFAKHTETEIQNLKNSNFFIDDGCQTGNISLESGATIESPTECKSVICFRDLENVDGMHISKQVLCSESESDWEQINSNEDDHFYSSNEDSMFNFLN